MPRGTRDHFLLVRSGRGTVSTHHRRSSLGSLMHPPLRRSSTHRVNRSTTSTQSAARSTSDPPVSRARNCSEVFGTACLRETRTLTRLRSRARTGVGGRSSAGPERAHLSGNSDHRHPGSGRCSGCPLPPGASHRENSHSLREASPICRRYFRRRSPFAAQATRNAPPQVSADPPARSHP